MDLNLGSTKALIDECRRQGLLRNQCADVLATGFWETGRTMKPVKETTSAKNPNPTDAQVKRILTRAWNAGKLPWVKKDYWSDGYFGRGFVQLTHLKNYEKASSKLGVDFVAHPEKVMEEKNAIAICVTGMKEGWFTGKKLSDYLTASKTDYPGARRIINGTDKKNEIAKLAREYEMDLEVLGYAQKKPAKAITPGELGNTRPAPVASIPPIEPKPVPAPEPASDKEMIERVQAALKLLNYNPGGIDGLMGPLTKGAIRVFRADNNLPEGDFIDDALISALATAKPREMVAARANATPSDVTAKVPEARHNWLSKITAGGLGGTAGAGVLVDGVLKNVTDAKSYVNEFTDYLANVPGWAWCLMILAVAGFIYWKSQQSENASVEAFQSGDRR